LDFPSRLVVFSLDEHLYALDLEAVIRTERMVDITPLPHAPEIVTGIINVRGEVVPVLDIRRRFRLAGRAAALSDQLLLARTARRTVVIAVDAVRGIMDSSSLEITGPEAVLPGIGYVRGVAICSDGMIFIHDLDGFLSLEEETLLETAISREELELQR
jgi:purine-binding chemotaxis protein CheW